jgi:hypothetical protein
MSDQIQPLARAPADLFRPRPGYRHVFAYGPLMAQKRIRKLCPDPRFVTTARYFSKRFVINDDGVATLVPRRDFTVYGVIWAISDIAQCGLDIALGMPGIRDRFGSLARGPDGQLVSSEYYGARNNRTIGKASHKYLQPILDAARHWNFPQSYLDEIGGWAQPEPRTKSTTRGGR